MHPVDALLQSARQLLGSTTAPEPDAADFGAPNLAGEHPASWQGPASTDAAAKNTVLDRNRDQLRTTYSSAAAVIASANQYGQQARTDLAAVDNAWQHDKATLGRNANTPQGQVALLQAAQQRLDEASRIVERTAKQYQQAAEQMRSTAGELPRSDDHTTHAAGFGTAPKAPAKDDSQQYWLDTDRIVELAPGAKGPYGYIELSPRSGVWVPDPNHYPPAGSLSPARQPVDLDRILRLPPGDRGPYGYKELVPNTGVWAPAPSTLVPTPDPGQPRHPIDLRDLVQTPVGGRGPYGYIELVPGAWIPDPDARHF